MKIVEKLLRAGEGRILKKLDNIAAQVNAIEEDFEKLTDAELRAETDVFKKRLADGETLDDILPEAFAAVREASKRTLGKRHFDVQIMGGAALHLGNVAEMKTGEGKTLVATGPVYLNALEGKGVHVITVNDYLATRDAEWMGKIYKFLGMSVGTVVNSQTDADKKRAYRSDITYGQNNEFGFDYLRDNMKFSALEYAQRPLHYAIVDEVDSILIDEARTPLIISGQGERSSEKYRVINEVIPRLKLDEHYVVDEKAHSVTLTEDGIVQAQKLLRQRGVTQIENLYEPVNLESLHILNQCLRAHTLYKRDVTYMVSEDNKVLIIDEFTGRVLPGRRWSDGLHQAVEAK
ncbi:MAG: preprotein translocase subunit SecA, partial [Ornithinibacter sp.]